MRELARIGIALMGLVGALTFTSLAEACKIAGANSWEAAPSVDNGTTPPSPPVLAELAVQRGKGPENSGCGQEVANSCDDIGLVRIRLTPSADDRTPAAGIGYRVFLVAGSLPGGQQPPTETVLLTSENIWQFVWIDGNTDSQEAIDFTVVFVAVDAAGNESAPSKEIRVQNSGDEAGCTMKRQGRPSPFAWLLPAVVLALLGRRALRA